MQTEVGNRSGRAGTTIHIGRGRGLPCRAWEALEERCRLAFDEGAARRDHENGAHGFCWLERIEVAQQRRTGRIGRTLA